MLNIIAGFIMNSNELQIDIEIASVTILVQRTLSSINDLLDKIKSHSKYNNSVNDLELSKLDLLKNSELLVGKIYEHIGYRINENKKGEGAAGTKLIELLTEELERALSVEADALESFMDNCLPKVNNDIYKKANDVLNFAKIKDAASRMNINLQPKHLSMEDWQELSQKPSLKYVHDITGFDPKTIRLYFKKFGIVPIWKNNI